MTQTSIKDMAAVGSADWVRAQAEIALNGADSEYPYAYVREVFDDHIIADAGIGILISVPYTVGDGEIVLNTADATQVQLAYVPKSQSPVLTGPIVMKSGDDEKRIAYAAVLVPGEPDSDGDVVSAEKIEAVAHQWLEEYRNIDLMHTLSSASATVVESYLTPAEMEVGEYTLPAGTWVMASKIADDDVWNAVKNGELTGYSIMGVRKAALKNAAIKSDAALKRTLLSDLGDDWVCPFVSIVDAPAVPKAKFFALKRAEQPKRNVLARLFTPPAIKAVDELSKETPVAAATNDEVMEKLNAISERLEALTTQADEAEKSDAESKTETTEVKTETKTEQTADSDNDDKQTIEELQERVKELEGTLTEVEKRLSTSTKSRALRGQDTDDDAAEKRHDDDRDMFGRRRRKTTTR